MDDPKTKLQSISHSIREFSQFIADIIWAVVDPHLTALYRNMDKGHWTKRLSLYLALAVSVYSIQWSFNFAAESERSGDEIAAIIAAVMIPVNGLTAIVYRYYTGFKKPPEDQNV